MVQPPAFPTTSRPRGGDGDGDLPVPGQKGFCACQGLRRRGGQRVSCNIDTSRVAFCGTENISTPNSSYAAQYLASSPVNASRLPSRTTRASLGASAVRCSFAVTDFYRLPLAGLPAHPSTHDTMRHAEEFRSTAAAVLGVYRCTKRSQRPQRTSYEASRPLKQMVCG